MEALRDLQFLSNAVTRGGSFSTLIPHQHRINRFLGKIFQFGVAYKTLCMQPY